MSEHTSSFDSTNQPGANSPGEAAAENGYNNALNSVRRVGDYGGNASQLGLVSEPPVRPAAPIHIAARSYNDDIAEGFNLQNFFEMLRRRRGVLFGTFGIVFVLGLLYTLLQRPIYKATAQILVATASGPGSSGAGASALRELIPDAQPRSLGTQVAILQSPPLQKAAVKRLKPAEQKEVRKFPSIEIRPVRDAEVISVAVAAYVPTTASNMANALCDQYILENEKQNEDQIQSTTLYVKNQLPPARARLDKAARALRDYQQKNETVSIDQETQARVTQLAQLDASRREAEAQSRASATEMAQLKQQIASLPVREESQTTTGVDPTAAALQTKLTTLENERRDALVEYTPTSRTVRDIERRIAGIRAQLSRIPKVSTNSRTQTLNPLRQSLLQSLANTQVAILSAQSRAKSLGESVQQERKGLRVLPERSYRLANLALDRAILEQSYRTLNDRYQNLLINASASGASVRVISPAEVPRRAISPNRKMNILLSVVLGILLALALAALVDRLDDRVHSTEDVEHVTGLPVLAHVPFIKNEAQQCLVGNTSKPSPLLESYRMLRSNLAFAGLDEPVRSVVLTSSQPGEGKSVSSVNLATVMALSGKSVIVVDCDLRRPKVHKLFGFPNRVGLTSVVSGNATLEEALLETSVPGLRILTSGPMPPNPPELLDSRAGRAVLQQVMDSADFVILDTPPALVMTDAQVVASLADAIILVVSNTEANKREVGRTSELLAHTSSKRVGIILNKVTPESGYHSYKSYGGYLSADDNDNDADSSNGNGVGNGLARSKDAVTPFDKKVT